MTCPGHDEARISHSHGQCPLIYRRLYAVGRQNIIWGVEEGKSYPSRCYGRCGAVLHVPSRESVSMDGSLMRANEWRSQKQILPQVVLHSGHENLANLSLLSLLRSHLGQKQLSQL